MLSRWFKRSSRLEHADREIRLQALQALNTEQAIAAQAILERMVLHDPDLEVRQAALPHISDPDKLATLLSDGEMSEQVAKQIAQTIKGGLRPNCHDHALVVQARIEGAGPGELDSLWPLLTTANQCAVLALRYKDETRERVLTHPLLNSEEGLGVLQRAARGKDKICHRYARIGLEAIKSARNCCAESSIRLHELDAAIDKALRAKPKDISGVITHRQQLKQLQGMRQQAVAAIENALATLREAGGADETPIIPDDPLGDIDLTPPAPGDDPFVRLCEDLDALATKMQQGESFEPLARQRDELTQIWLSHADTYPPSLQQHQKFEAVSRQYQAYQAAQQRLRTLTDVTMQTPPPLPDPPENALSAAAALQTMLRQRQKWRKQWRKPVQNLRWPADHTPPQAVQTALADLARIEHEIEQLTHLLATAEQNLSTAISAATQAMDAGQFEQAKGYLRNARQLQKNGVHKFNREVATLSAQMAEIRDWQQFVTDPKRQQLLQQLQGICDTPLEPPAQADRLKSLREQWRQLGRPGSAAEDELQRQFDALAEIAFAPSKVYFAEQSEIRATNLAKREALCTQLADYLQGTDWTGADMTAAESIMRRAREEWQGSHPCDRGALKPVLQRFEALQKLLFEKVKAARDANVLAKQSIVDQATALLDQEVESQVEGAKSLQRAWREIGSTPRGQDQRLWRQFRQICDQIFAQREVQQKQQQAQIDARYQTLEESISSFENAASQSTVTRKELKTLGSAIDTASDGLTVNAKQRKRIDSAQSDYREALKKEDANRERRDLQQWQQWDEQVSLAEQSSTTIEPPHAIFAGRTNGTAQADDLLNLTLEAEIAADLPSPQQDQGARMALQIEFMNAGKRNLAGEDYRQLRQRWCEAGPKDAAANTLRERFFKALHKRL